MKAHEIKSDLQGTSLSAQKCERLFYAAEKYDPDTKNKFITTAIAKGHLPFVKLALENDADNYPLDIVNGDGKTALEMLITKSSLKYQTEIFQLIRDNCQKQRNVFAIQSHLTRTLVSICETDYDYADFIVAQIDSISIIPTAEAVDFVVSVNTALSNSRAESYLTVWTWFQSGFFDKKYITKYFQSTQSIRESLFNNDRISYFFTVLQDYPFLWTHLSISSKIKLQQYLVSTDFEGIKHNHRATRDSVLKAIDALSKMPKEQLQQMYTGDYGVDQVIITCETEDVVTDIF